MFNTSLTVLLITNFFIITILFWVITLLELIFNKNTDNSIKTDVYECGFNTVSKINFPVTLNTIILLFFVLIYEVEFILLTPLMLLTTGQLNSIIINLTLLFFIIIITLYLDIWLKKIYWVYKCLNII